MRSLWIAFHSIYTLFQQLKSPCAHYFRLTSSHFRLHSHSAPRCRRLCHLSHSSFSQNAQVLIIVVWLFVPVSFRSLHSQPTILPETCEWIFFWFVFFFSLSRHSQRMTGKKKSEKKLSYRCDTSDFSLFESSAHRLRHHFSCLMWNTRAFKNINTRQSFLVVVFFSPSQRSHSKSFIFMNVFAVCPSFVARMWETNVLRRWHHLQVCHRRQLSATYDFKLLLSVDSCFFWPQSILFFALATQREVNKCATRLLSMNLNVTRFWCGEIVGTAPLGCHRNLDIHKMTNAIIYRCKFVGCRDFFLTMQNQIHELQIVSQIKSQ